ncbi:MAG: hypothetical protein RLP44_02480 [Aggregatilineales bacterium]
MNIQEEVARRVRNGINALKSELRAGGVDPFTLDQISITETDKGIIITCPDGVPNEEESRVLNDLADEIDEATGAKLSEPVARKRKASKQDDGDAE